MAKKRPSHAILILNENTHEVYKHCVQVTLDGSGVAKKYQVYLRHKPWQNLTEIDTCENIRLIQACIYHGYYKMLSKGQWITAIHHSLMPYGLLLPECYDP